MLEIVSRSGRPLSELLRPLRERYFISGEINSTVSDVPVKLQQLKERYGPKAERVSHMDGISFEFPDWHFNVRPSNTEPLLRLNLEALGRTSVTWAFDAYRADTGEHLVSANQVAVFIDTAARRPVEVPEVFRDEVARFEEQEVEA